MANEMMCDSGDDCILIGELNDEKCVTESSSQVIIVPSSSDETEKEIASAKSSETEVMHDDVNIQNERQVTVQQNCAAAPSTETATVDSSCHLQRSKSCKKCGRFGSEESFYGQNYCSVKCAQSFRFKQQSQSSTPDAASPTSSVQTNSFLPVQSSSTTAASKFVRSSGVVPVSAAKQSSNNRTLDWKEYVLRENAAVAPVTCFKHCPFSESFSRSLLVGIKLEVINIETEITEYPVYWMASVIDVAGYAVCLRYEGYEDDVSHDFWISFYSDDVHHVGWCAANARPLVPPKLLQYRVSDWKEFLLRKLIGANTLQPSVHVKAKASFQRCPLRPGMWLEVVDRTCLSVMTVATVDNVIGSRMRLRYHQSEIEEDFFFCHCMSSLIHPVGWSQTVGHRLKATPGYKSSSLNKVSLKKYQKLDATPKMFYKVKCPLCIDKFQAGMKLEAVDPLNLGTICVATIDEVLCDGYLMIDFDGSVVNNAVGAESPEKCSYLFCYHASSPYIFPVGFCAKNGIALSVPKGFSTPFSWPDYLEATGSLAVPDECFSKEIPEHGFKVGMKLESADLMEPRLVCMGTVEAVVGRLLRIHFDGWESTYDQWMDCSSPDIYPLGWSEIVGHPLDVPQDAATVGQLLDKKKPKNPAFRGGRKKRRYKAQLTDSATVAAADQVSAATSTPVIHAPAVKGSPSISPLRKKMKIGETNDVTTADVVMNSAQKLHSDEMPKLSPPDVNFKLQASMPDLLHSSM